MGKKRTGHPGHLYLIQTQSLKCMMKLHGVDKAPRVEEPENGLLLALLSQTLWAFGSSSG